MSTWPATLPQVPLLEGFKDEPQDSVLRTEFTGFSKQRNRYTAVIHDVEERYLLTPTQFQTFKTFYEDTLGNGTAEFIKPDPVEGINRNYRFAGVYTFNFTGVFYIVRLTLEKLP